MDLSDPSPKIAVDREKNNGIEHRPASRVNLASAFWALSRVALQDQDAHTAGIGPAFAARLAIERGFQFPDWRIELMLEGA